MTQPKTTKVSKPVIKLAPPYTAPSWPELGREETETVLSMLCSLLEHIGAHSRAARPKLKRKRKLSGDDISSESAQNPPKLQDVEAGAPQISSHLLIGLNSVTRHLEAMAGISKPSDFHHRSEQSPIISHEADNAKKHTHVSILFAPVPKNQLILDHLPLLAQVASQAHQELPATLILRLRGPAEERLAAALNVPRVSVIGLLESAVDADSQARSLIQFVRGLVKPTIVPWLEEASKWMGTKVITDAEDKKR